MLKLIRHRAIENPVFFRGIMFILAVTFAISLGWWGMSGETTPSMAQVGDKVISREAYNRVYKNTSRFYKEVVKAPFDEKILRKQILDQMVDQKLWIAEAIRLDIQVTDDELKASIVKLPGFQENGQFSPERYRRILVFEKMTPEQFEEQQREEMMINKAKDLIRDGAALTLGEIEDVEKSGSPDKEKTRQDKLNQKQERAVRAYTMALKEKTTVSIHEEML